MTSVDISRVAAEALCSERTVRRWLDDPASVNENNRLRIEQGVKKLKVSMALRRHKNLDRVKV